MVTITLPAGWTQGVKTTFTCDAGPLPEVIRQFVADHPDYRRRLLGPDDELLAYINICVDDDLIPRHLRADTVVEAGSAVIVMSPMAGG